VDIQETGSRRNCYTFVGFEVLKAVVRKSSIFCNITPYSPLKFNRRFGENVASIFRVEKYAEQETRVKAGCMYK
jgi:hypothetical protein